MTLEKRTADSETLRGGSYEPRHAVFRLFYIKWQEVRTRYTSGPIDAMTCISSFGKYNGFLSACMEAGVRN